MRVDRCAQAGCTGMVTHRVYWPGAELLTCEQHKEKARSVGVGLGFEVRSTEITVELPVVDEGAP